MYLFFISSFISRALAFLASTFFSTFFLFLKFESSNLMKRIYHMSINSSFMYFMEKYELFLIKYLFLFLLRRRNWLQFLSLLQEEETGYSDQIKKRRVFRFAVCFGVSRNFDASEEICRCCSFVNQMFMKIKNKLHLDF